MAKYRVAFEVTSTLSIEELSKVFYKQFDGVLVERVGQIIVTVYTEGDTGLDAARAVIEQLERLDLSICHIDYDLVDGPEIAVRLGVTRQAVHLWATGSRGSGFPHPVGSPGGKRVWVWSEVVEWARARQGSTETPGPTRDELALVDAYLVERRRAPARLPA